MGTREVKKTPSSLFVKLRAILISEKEKLSRTFLI
jgi:hypothetical protein